MSKAEDVKRKKKIAQQEAAIARNERVISGFKDKQKEAEAEAQAAEDNLEQLMGSLGKVKEDLSSQRERLSTTKTEADRIENESKVLIAETEESRDLLVREVTALERTRNKLASEKSKLETECAGLRAKVKSAKDLFTNALDTLDDA